MRPPNDSAFAPAPGRASGLWSRLAPARAKGRNMPEASWIGLLMLALTAATPARAADATDGPPRAGLALWYAADEGAVLENGSLKEWRDLSGHGNHATRVPKVANNL